MTVQTNGRTSKTEQDGTTHAGETEADKDRSDTAQTDIDKQKQAKRRQTQDRQTNRHTDRQAGALNGEDLQEVEACDQCNRKLI